MPEQLFIDGDSLTAQKVNDYLNHTLLSPETYTPTVGGADAIATATYQTIGQRVEVEFFISFAGPSGSAVVLGLPAPVANVGLMGASRHAVGQALAYDTSAGLYRPCLALVAGVAHLSFIACSTGAIVGSSAPFAWASGDTLRGRAAYWTDE